MATTKKRPDRVSEFFNEPIFYGGLICTRIEAINDMRAQGMSEVCIDRWVQGAQLAPLPTALFFDDGDDFDAETWETIGVTPAAAGKGKNQPSIAHYFEVAS